MLYELSLSDNPKLNISLPSWTSHDALPNLAEVRFGNCSINGRSLQTHWREEQLRAAQVFSQLCHQCCIAQWILSHFWVRPGTLDLLQGWSEHSLTVLDLSFNYISGTLPPEWGDKESWAMLEGLALSDNILTGNYKLSEIHCQAGNIQLHAEKQACFHAS